MQRALDNALARARARTWSVSTVVLICVAVTCLLRLPFITMPMSPDEGGYAYVAAQWRSHEGGLYGAQWVDRPPLLFVLYAGALTVAGDLGIRLLGMLTAIIFVVASAAAAGRVAGPVAARWAAATATVLGSSTIIQAHTFNAELPATAFVTVAVWMLVAAAGTTSSNRSAAALAAGSGITATCAVLVKQSFVDGFVFAAVFLVIIAIRAGLERRRFVTIVGAGAIGTAVAVAAVVVWAERWGPGFPELAQALYGFRLDARTVIDSAPGAPRDRGRTLLVIAVVSGLLALFVLVVSELARIVFVAPRAKDRASTELVRAGAGALVAMGVFGLIAVLIGGNFWRHYLIQLSPMLAIGAGIVAATDPVVDRPRWSAMTRASAGFVVLVTASVWIASITLATNVGPERRVAVTASWLRAAAAPTDTALITWGHPDLLHRTGLTTPYDMSWSLPIRVRDPKLAQVTRLIASADAPTWVVRWRAFSSWGLDADGRFRSMIEQRYDLVATVCGKRIYRLREAPAATGSSSLPSTPPTASCESAKDVATIGGLRLW